MNFTPDYRRWGTHLPLLRWAVENTSGAVLELGAGNYSTPYLSSVAKRGRSVMTVEYDYGWRMASEEKYASANHEFRYHMPMQGLFDVVLVDQGPKRRRGSIEYLRPRVRYFVVHDTEPEEEMRYELAPVLESFRYRFDDRLEDMPQTTIVSDTDEIALDSAPTMFSV